VSEAEFTTWVHSLPAISKQSAAPSAEDSGGRESPSSGSEATL
jgi:hypothetical protein